MADVTLETIKQVMRRIDQMSIERDLDLFLSDSWPAVCILREGGQLVQVNGQWYAVSVPKLEFHFDPFPWLTKRDAR